MEGTVLVADGDRASRTVLTQALTRAGCRVHATSSMLTLMRWVEEGRGDLVILDTAMPDGNGIEDLPKIAALRPGLPVIVIAAQDMIMTATEAAERNAYEHLSKPFALPDLMRRAARALGITHPAPARPPETPEGQKTLPLVGRAPVMQQLYRLMAQVMNAPLPVLITGESGTGKSLIARAIHDVSDRRRRPFVVVSISDLEEGEDLRALFARARGGALLFEEIGEFPGEAQGRIVRILDMLDEEGARIISTSRVDLAARIEAGSFREDLYYRLGGVRLDVPPLRERGNDAPLLADHFLIQAEREGAPPRRLSGPARDLIRAHDWPGNVRQLENVIRHLAVIAAEAEITEGEIKAALGSCRASAPGHGEGDRLAATVASHLRRYFDLHGEILPPPGLYQRILREIELPLIEVALKATGGNQAKCAELLGINRNTLRKKILDLDIRVARSRKLM